MHSHDTPIPALLDALPPKVRDRLLEDSTRKTFKAGETLVREGDSALNLFVIVSGHARIDRADAGFVGRFGPGDFFGEIALLDETGRTATVVAEDDLTCYLIPAWEFRALLEEHPRMAIPMLHKLIGRLHGH